MSDILNKYRPETFGNIFGNKDVIIRLKELIADGSKSHNILFYGSPGVGKTTLALAFARELGANELNIHEYQLRGINDVRDMVDNRLGGAPLGGKAKVVIANEAQFLTPDAQVELLTPTERSHNPYLSFILTTTNHKRLDSALSARFIHLEVKPLSVRESLQLLGFLSSKENVVLDMPVVKAILEITGGNPRQIVLTFDSVYKLKTASEQLERLTNDPTEEEISPSIKDLANAIIKKDLYTVTLLYNKLSANPESTRIGLFNYLRGCAVNGVKNKSEFKIYIDAMDKFTKGMYDPSIAKSLLYLDIMKACGV